MLLQGEQAIEALYHLTKPRADLRDADGNPVSVAVIHEGKRYGGFRDEAHAGFFIRTQGWTEAVIRYVPRAR